MDLHSNIFNVTLTDIRYDKAMLIDNLVKYLRAVLNVTLSVNRWKEDKNLPLYLLDEYVCYQAEIHGLEFLLMVDAGNEERPPSMVIKHVGQIQARCGGEVIYIREQMSAYNRKRLIETGIQFIVPGNQLYLPKLAIDLREYFRRERRSVRNFSPATQALVLYRIFNASRITGIPATSTGMAQILGYTKMTMSRAFKEANSALDEVVAADKSGNTLHSNLHGRELWDRFQPFLRNPVGQRHYLLKDDFNSSIGLRAGLTALAAYSMLAKPDHEVYAVSRNEWMMFRQSHDVTLLNHADTQTVEVEVWNYPPQLFAHEGMKGVVDPLSLYLSFKENRDERIENALEELIRGVR
jgi:hypothetical protein